MGGLVASWLRSVGHRLRWGRAGVVRARADDAVVGVLLEGMGAPPDHPAGREGGREQITRQPAALHHHGGVPLDVGVQLTSGLQLGEGALDLGFDLRGELDSVAAELLGHLTQHHRARIGGAIDGMAEPHDAIAVGDRLTNPCGGVVGVPNGVERVEGPAG